MRVGIAAIMLSLFAVATPAAEPPSIRLGLLAFGTVQWEIDTMRSQGLDGQHGITVVPTEMAGKDGTAVALLAGSVDAIVGDWPWVSRQRAMGQDFTFVPWSMMTGAVLVPADSPIHSLADLKGKRIGIAGGPLDKSWLLLRALAARRHGLDLDVASEKSFGAPPLLAQMFETGRLDALLTFWQAAIPLEVKGMRRLIDIGTIPAELGIASPPPLVGWIFRRDWADSHRTTIQAFLAAERETRSRLCAGDSLWPRLRPLTRVDDADSRARLRQGFCAAIPTVWGERERQDGANLFGLLSELGGPELVGPLPGLSDGTFWPEVVY